MAQEYISVKTQNEIGVVALNKSVFTTIAKIAVDEDDAIVLNESSNLFKYPIGCKLVDGKMVLTIEVKVNTLQTLAMSAASCRRRSLKAYLI